MRGMPAPTAFPGAASQPYRSGQYATAWAERRQQPRPSAGAHSRVRSCGHRQGLFVDAVKAPVYLLGFFYLSGSGLPLRFGYDRGAGRSLRRRLDGPMESPRVARPREPEGEEPAQACFLPLSLGWVDARGQLRRLMR